MTQEEFATGMLGAVFGIADKLEGMDEALGRLDAHAKELIRVMSHETED